jgi:hypothetical protein
MKTALFTAVLLCVTAIHVGAAPSAGARASIRSKTLVSLGSRPPDRFPAGAIWSVIVTLWKRPVMCQSPRFRISYPLVDLKPRVIVRNADTGEQRRFIARATSNLGDYRAKVVFPSAGNWSYSVDDRHGVIWRFGSVSVANPGPGPSPPNPRLRGKHPALHVLPGGRLRVRVEHAASRASRRVPFFATFELWRVAECRAPRVRVEYPVLSARMRVRFRERGSGRTIYATIHTERRSGSYVVRIRLPERGVWDYALLIDGGRPKPFGTVRVS